MFCGKCGNNIPDGVAFCSQCGASMGNNPGQNPVQSPLSSLNVNLPTNALGASTTNKGILFYIGIIVCQILAMLGWFGESVSLNTFLGDHKVAISALMEEADVGFINVVFVIAFILAIAPVLLTIVTKSDKLMLSPLVYIGAILMLLGFAVTLIVFGEYNNEARGFAEAGFNFLGVLAIISTVVTMILPTMEKKYR